MSLKQQISSLAEYSLMSVVLKCSDMIGAVSDAIFKLVKKERRLIESYRHGYVSLQKIIWKAKPYEALDATINKNFILKHEKFVDAEYVLKSNVSLFSIGEDGDFVIFTETESTRDVYSSDEGPFLYITQFRLATHLVIMSMDTFNILAQSLPQSEAKLIIVANTGRSGSTLLAQMFESIKGTKVLSEPHTLLDALYLYNNNKLDEESYTNLLMNIIKIHVACVNTKGDLESIIIKPMFKCTPQIKIIKERYPRSSLIFLYRNLQESVTSFMRVMSAFQKLAAIFTARKSEIMDWWCKDLPLPYPPTTYTWARDQVLQDGLSLKSAIALNWCCTVTCVRDYMKLGVSVLCINYGQLVHENDKTWKQITNFCQITPERKSMSYVLSRDSQRGAFLSQGTLKSAVKSKQNHRKNIDGEDDIENFLKSFQIDPSGTF